MHDVSRPQLAVYAAAAVAVALIGARYLQQTRAADGSPASSPALPVRVDRAGGGFATVHVAGAVRRPGVYRLGPGARVDDAVRRAGGPRGDADLAGVNLAARLEDGRQVIVPVRAPPLAAGAVPGAGVAATAATPGVPLDLNTATAEQLDTLDGVGPATAQKIVAYREEHGGFRSVDELDRVPGIGDKRLAALRERVRV